MKKVMSLIMTISMLLTFAMNSLASEKEFSLIEYLETNEITSHEELIEVIAENTGNAPVRTYTSSLRYLSDENEVYFNVEVDQENGTVEVDTVYESVAATTSTRSGAATHETYSSIGVLMYTVTINGTFSYSSSSVSTTSKSGSFTKAPSSFWSSTPSITSGKISTTKAYARISGTATFLWESSSYELTLMCDTSGKLTSSFTRP